MNKITTFLLIFITALNLIFAATKQSKAQSQGFAGVIPFVTGNDRVGFLDQNNGKVYIYDNNISRCLFVGQIQNLGQTIQSVPVNAGT